MLCYNMLFKELVRSFVFINHAAVEFASKGHYVFFQPLQSILSNFDVVHILDASVSRSNEVLVTAKIPLIIAVAVEGAKLAAIEL